MLFIQFEISVIMKNQERLNLFLKWVLFLTAYYPLFLIIAIKNTHINNLLPIFWNTFISPIFIVAVLGLFLYILLQIFLFTQKRATKKEIKIENVKDLSNESLSYILTYLIAFLQINLTTPNDIICILILLFIIGVIYTGSNLIHVNPILYLLGYTIYEAEASTSSVDKKVPVIIIANSSCDVRKEATLKLSLVNDGIKKIYFT